MSWRKITRSGTSQAMAVTDGWQAFDIFGLQVPPLSTRPLGNQQSPCSPEFAYKFAPEFILPQISWSVKWWAVQAFKGKREEIKQGLRLGNNFPKQPQTVPSHTDTGIQSFYFPISTFSSVLQGSIELEPHLCDTFSQTLASSKFFTPSVM